jgi:hypothetical protein
VKAGIPRFARASSRDGSDGTRIRERTHLPARGQAPRWLAPQPASACRVLVERRQRSPRTSHVHVTFVETHLPNAAARNDAQGPLYQRLEHECAQTCARSWRWRQRLTPLPVPTFTRPTNPRALVSHARSVCIRRPLGDFCCSSPCQLQRPFLYRCSIHGAARARRQVSPQASGVMPPRSATRGGPAAGHGHTFW